jgi:hypothetical protein
MDCGMRFRNARARSSLSFLVQQLADWTRSAHQGRKRRMTGRRKVRRKEAKRK